MATAASSQSPAPPTRPAETLADVLATLFRVTGTVKHDLTALFTLSSLLRRRPGGRMDMAAAEVPWLGQRIREERMRRGVSLRALARMVGVSASMISQIETAKSQPSVSTLYSITSALGVSVEDLFTPQPAPALAAQGAGDAPVPRPAVAEM